MISTASSRVRQIETEGHVNAARAEFLEDMAFEGLEVTDVVARKVGEQRL